MDVSPQNVTRVALRLAASYPASDLGNPEGPLDDLIYLILSGQTNEISYQATFRTLKVAYPGWKGLAQAKKRDIAACIIDGGLAKQKAAYLKALLTQIEKDRGRPSLDHLFDLSTTDAEAYLKGLPGVGIKTARCVLMYALGRDVFPADGNCLRIMERLGWLEWKGRRAELLADTAQELVPGHLRRSLHIDMIQHVRAVCTPSAPQCGNCCLRDLCSTAKLPPAAPPTVVDLCCGAGGFSWGFMQAGYNVLLGVDTCRNALATYAANISGAKTACLDVTGKKTLQTIQTELDGKTPDVVIAGPPCQGFSRAGPRKPDDPRNKVLAATVKRAVQLQPKVIVIENVLFLRGPAFSHHLRSARGIVRRAGYRSAYAVIDSRSFGVAQTRQRIVFIAAKTEDRELIPRILQTLSTRTHVPGLTVAGAFAGLPEAGTEDGHTHNHVPMQHSRRVIKKIQKIKPGEGPLSYRKLHPARPAPTVVCGHRALPCHYFVPRTITTREAARLQGFWDDFRFFGPRSTQMLQVANAVPPRLSLGVALAGFELLAMTPPPHVKSLLEQLLGRSTYRPTI